MPTLIVGSTGAVGSRVVKELLKSSYTDEVRLLCRSDKSFPEEVKTNPQVKIITGSIMKLSDDELKEMVGGCETVVSCLGHRVKKIWSPPYNLCVGAVEKLSKAIRETNNGEKVKLIVVSTVAASHPDGSDRKIRSFMQNRVFGMLHVLIPPHKDNIRTSRFLYKIGQNDPAIEWCGVRPDGLTNKDDETKGYVVYPDIQAGLFNAKSTQRLNVAKFMVELATDANAWSQWKNSFPVVYDEGQFKEKVAQVKKKSENEVQEDSGGKKEV